MTDRKRILKTATLVMLGLAVLASAVGTAVSYRKALAQERSGLLAVAQRQAQFIEGTWRHETQHHGRHNHLQFGVVDDCPACQAVTADLVKLLGEIHVTTGRLRNTGEIVIAHRDGDGIRFLLPYRHHVEGSPKERRMIPWESDLAEPMRLALSGKSGVVEQVDHRGEGVLAAYAPVKLLGWGVVAKIDTAEVRAPFVSAARDSLLLAALTIVVGVIVLRKRLNPLVQRLQKSEEQAQNALSKLRSQKLAMDEHSIVAITDPSGIITYANDKFCAVSKYARDELIGRDHRIVNSGHHPRAFFAEMWRSIANGEVWQGEIRNRAKDGSFYWVDTTIVPFKDGAGRITQYVAVQTDISARKRSEEVLERRVAETHAMNRALQEVNRQLEKAKCAAEGANEAKSEFLANMSHEIRTPMTAILGFAENLQDHELSESERLNCIHTIRRNGEYLLGIINDILDLSKIEAGKMTIEQKTCHPCRIIAEVASLIRVRADEKGLPFNFEYIGAVPETIQSDPTRLRQILINLIGNAVKFTDTGAVRLVTRLVSGEGKDSLCNRNDREDRPPGRPVLQFDVIDTGRGMTEEQVGRLFRPFTQGNTSTTRKFGGMGLGLAISKRFAEMLGGDITVAATEVRVGTTFRATVATGPLKGVRMIEDPLSATVVTGHTAAVARSSQPNLHGCRILLAEDGPDNQRLISFVLKKAGAEVTVTENGKLALDAALAARDEGQPFDCLLMDMQMPVTDGYEATSRLRQKGYIGPIIALTAHVMEGDRRKCLKAGCNDYASKPIDRAKLMAVIRKYWQPDRLNNESKRAAVLKEASYARF